MCIRDRPYLNAALEISAGCADFAAAGSVAGVCLCLSLLGASVLAQLAALLQGCLLYTSMGLSLNPSSVEEVDDVMKELQAQKSVVQAYVMDEIFDKMEGGEAAMAPYYADVYKRQRSALVILVSSTSLPDMVSPRLCRIWIRG